MVPEADGQPGLTLAAADHAGDPPERRHRRWPWILAAGLLVTYLVVRLSVAETFRIPTESMTPTLQPGDSVLVDKLAYKGGGTPDRGEMVVFHEPRTGDIVLKRVVALGGDTVGLQDGRLVVDGRRPVEPYTDPDAIDSVYFGPVTVPHGSVFVLGDNRLNSKDSRRFGTVRNDRIIGRVRARVWPPSRWASTG